MQKRQLICEELGNVQRLVMREARVLFGGSSVFTIVVMALNIAQTRQKCFFSLFGGIYSTMLLLHPLCLSHPRHFPFPLCSTVPSLRML